MKASKKIKAILSWLLALTVTLTVGAPAFAADAETTVSAEETTGFIEETTVSAEETTARVEETTFNGPEETTAAPVEATTSAPVEETTAAPQPSRGLARLADADADGSVTVSDARAALRYAVALDEPSADDADACDVDFGGSVEVDDARAILRVAIGLDCVAGLVSGRAGYSVERGADGNHTYKWTEGEFTYSGTEKCVAGSVAETLPTCVAEGERSYSCPACGRETKLTLAKLAHSYTGQVRDNGNGTHSFMCTRGCAQYGGESKCVYAVTENVAATCWAEGRTVQTCAKCGHRTETRSPRLEHSFTKYVSDGNATWLADGTKTAVCDNPGCDVKKTVADPGSRLNTSQIPSSVKVLFMTFDDGPSRYTDRIIGILDRYGAKATWFVVNSSYTSGYSAIVRSGNAIALHSYTHDYSDIYRSTANFYADLQRISDKVYNLTGVRTYLHRFPGGSSNTVSRSYCRGIMSYLTRDIEARGYRYFDWNSANDDATGESLSAYQIYRRAIQYAGSSNRLVMLMHDTDAKYNTVAALPDIIEYYQSRGYVCLALDMYSPTAHHSVQN